MNTMAALQLPIETDGSWSPRDGIVPLFMRLAGVAGAENYLLTEALGGCGGEAPSIMAANWTFDAIQAVGMGALASLCAGPLATLPGQAPRIASAAQLRERRLLESHAARALETFGHAELCCLVLQVGPQRHVALFSAARPGTLAEPALARVQMEASHAMSAMPERLSAHGQARSPVGARTRMPALGCGRQDHGRDRADPRGLRQYRQFLHHPLDPQARRRKPRDGGRLCDQKRHHLMEKHPTPC